MRFRKVGRDQKEIMLDNGNLVLLSFHMPIAARIIDQGYVRTNVYHSLTRQRHIIKWVGDNPCTYVTQEYLNQLMDVRPKRKKRIDAVLRQKKKRMFNSPLED